MTQLLITAALGNLAAFFEPLAACALDRKKMRFSLNKTDFLRYNNEKR